MPLDAVRDYYARVLKSSADLKTDACCDSKPPPAHVRAALANVHEAVQSRYYGCGLVIPDRLDGLTILDLGCGAGRDVYILAQLVGPQGLVIGVDATEEQIGAARRYERHHAQAFGFAAPNTRFLSGPIERLDALGIEPGSVDVIVSNCVVNLCDDKQAILEQVRRTLKPGGEFYFSDVYADRRLPAALGDDPVLVGECLAGALYWGDFLALAKRTGFADPRLVESRPLSVSETSLAAKLGRARFFSATYRLFKLDGLEPACEDYGQAVIYKGDIAHCPDVFALDAHHRIEAGRAFPVCGNTWRMLRETRFAPHFQFIGDFSRHYGLFEGCGQAMPFTEEPRGDARDACC